MPSFTLATTTGTPAYSPRLRTLIFRGFFAELPENKHNPADLNPRVYSSEMLAFTTDVRMSKVGELGGGAGGGEVEACFWVEDVQTQWRVRGRCWFLGGAGQAEERARGEVGKYLCLRPDAAAPPREWAFSQEVTAHFGNLSPELRGSFKGPPPGGERDPRDDGRGRLGQVVGDGELGDEVARGNFRVAVVVVGRVESVDLREGRRKWWERAEGEGGWRTGEVWP
ncbi:MAG: hypothetical protein M1839_004597 [Geoglossum umbratile]|nr:MAG: hypothetical protein M1839_004597 [Geoglossum umbratile]